MFFEIACLILVAALWGCTNPLLKKNTKEIVKVKAESPVARFLLELRYLLTNYKYLIPMALNQAGSVLYFLTLQTVDLSLSVPVANSLTFIFTAISGCVLGESPPSKRVVFGMVCVLIGTSLCCYDKYLSNNAVER